LETLDKYRLKTMTGEHYMVTRLHFHCASQSKLKSALKKLKCIAFDESQNQWAWMYSNEARKIKFSIAYEDINPKMHPIVLGRIQMRSEREGFLNLNSFERTTKALEFFDKYIGRRTLKFTDVDVVNKILSPEEAKQGAHSRFFSTKPINSAELAEERLQKLMSLKALSPENGLQALVEFTDSAMRSFELIERLPCNFYEKNGLQSIKTALTMREIVAMRHWSGDTDFTVGELIKTITSGMQPSFADKLST